MSSWYILAERCHRSTTPYPPPPPHANERASFPLYTDILQMASHWPSWDCRHHWHLFKTWGNDSYWHSCPGGDGQPHLVLWFGHSVSPKRPVHWNLGHRCKQCSEVALRSIDCLSGTLSSSKTPSLHRLLEGDDTGGGQGSGNCRNRVMGDVPWKDTIYPQPPQSLSAS